MKNKNTARQVEPELLAAWLAARSAARGLPQPVPDHGGMRVDTGLPNEHRRYVFSGPMPAIQTLARSIDTPLTFIKMCGPGDQLRALVPPQWHPEPDAYFMTQAEADDTTPRLPAGYRIALGSENLAVVARIFAADGSLAASGYAMEYAGVFIFDRILTEAAHRRRGLGKALMAALGATQQSKRSQRVLVATADGSALYATLGWTVHSPYSTVVRQQDAAG